MTSERQRVEDAFASGRLTRPDAGVPNFVDLVRALAGLTGADGFPLTDHARGIQRRIGEHDHYALVLIDGLGADQLDQAYDMPFLRAHAAARLQSVFLSTTACALTTLATGLWPAEHAAPGWWTYLPDRRLSLVTLPFVVRNTERSLETLGLRARDVFPAPSFWPRMQREAVSFFPEKIAHSVYTRYSTGDTPRRPYRGLTEALDRLVERVKSAARPGFTYLYIPHLDSACHEKGTTSRRTRKLAAALDRLLARAAEALAGRARLVVTADHGHVDVPPGRRFVLEADDPLAARLLAQPAGEPCTPMFHVRPGEEDAFRRAFSERFGECFALLSAAEVEAMRLLGPEPLSDAMRRRLGAFVGVALEPAKFYVLPCDGKPQNPGVHGGLTPIEMHAPLVVI